MRWVSIGKCGLVEETIGFPQAIRYLGSLDAWVTLNVSPSGLAILPVAIEYESSDCTGSGFVAISETPPGSFTVPVQVSSDGLAYYPVGSEINYVYNSFKGVNGVCQSFGSVQHSGVRFATFPASELGSFTPPFKLSR
jgi:hypothetical protein